MCDWVVFRLLKCFFSLIFKQMKRRNIFFVIFLHLKVTWVVWCLTPLTTYYNISVISWRSVLLVEETGVHGENHKSAVSHWLKSHEDTFNGEIFSIINECKTCLYSWDILFFLQIHETSVYTWYLEVTLCIYRIIV